ncbi:MAG TPA: TolC family protein, partial [Spirochaetia bacterium]|nr:TolC family protein [Spirochaetia bacterium]
LPALVGGPVTVSLAGPQDAYSFGVSVRYPVFAGFRLMQAAKIAGLQTTGKELGIQIVRNALTFEVERTYWEAVRASANVTTMLKNKDLVGVLLGQVKDQLDQGLATESDLLSAEESYNQAQIMLNDAISGRNQAFLVLSSFLGQDKVGEELAGSGSGGFSADAVAAYVLSTDPAKSLFPELDGKLDPSKLVAEALANRPEMQTAAVGLETARRAVAASQGALYPTLALIGDYSYANPNQRVLIANGQFTGTWDVGVALSIDVGKLPANAAGAKAAGSDETRAQAQTDAERSKIILDVRKSLLAFEQARQDLAMTQSMVSQADEYLRVTQQKFDNGLAKHSDVLQAELAQLRAHFAVTNKQVDLQIASADLARALGLGAAT